MRPATPPDGLSLCTQLPGACERICYLQTAPVPQATCLSCLLLLCALCLVRADAAGRAYGVQPVGSTRHPRAHSNDSEPVLEAAA